MKKKEILIITLIVILTLGIAFSSTIIDIFKKNEIQEEVTEEKEEKFIIISFKGELLKEIDIKAKKGVSFGYLYQFLENYLNSYSIVKNDFNETYYESKTIIIESIDIKEEPIEEEIENKIDINKALTKDLVKLYGIGDKRALRIIEYRSEKKIEDWLELQKLIEVSDYVIEQIKKEAVL